MYIDQYIDYSEDGDLLEGNWENNRSLEDKFSRKNTDIGRNSVMDKLENAPDKRVRTVMLIRYKWWELNFTLSY